MITHSQSATVSSVTSKLTDPAAGMGEPLSQAASPPKASSQQEYSYIKAPGESL